MSDLIQIDHLRKRFGDVQAVDDLSFRVKAGELFAFLGVNGAGKSTTINILCGQLPKDGGTVSICGTDLDADPDRIKRSLGVVFQNSVLDKDLTVRDNLQSRAALYGIRGRAFAERLNELARLLNFGDLLKRSVGKLSGGQRRRIDIARALLHNPQILVLDEPTTGMDAAFKEEFAAILKELTEEGKTIVLVSHDVEFCAEYADLCAMFFDGSVLTTEPPRKFFSGNTFYTTAACRMARRVFPGAVTCQEVIRCCRN